MSRRGARFSIGAWMAVVLGPIVLAPLLTATGLYTGLSWWQGHTEDARLTAARRVISVVPARWMTTTWQESAREKLADIDVDALLFTADGRQVLATAPALPRPPRPWQEWIGEKDPLPGSGQGKGGGVAALFVSIYPASSILIASLAGGLLALLPTLAVVAWLLRRALVAPMTAMSRATHALKDGLLDVPLPASPIQEVADLAIALEGMSAGLRDATDRQTAMERERRLFIGAIAHDLRTPIFTLRAYLGGLSDGLATSAEKAARYIAVCQEKAAILDRLVGDLFIFARLDYLEQAPRREPLDLGALLHQAVDDCRARATSAAIGLTVDDPGRPAPLAGDRDLLRRAVDNLLDNALRYTPSGGEIRVAWTVEGERLLFGVADTGPGLAAHDLPHLFTPLYRGEPSRSRETGGAGLGLAIAQRILRAHGGDLSAANGAHGGALFTGALPLARNPPGRDGMPSRPEQGPQMRSTDPAMR